MARMSFGEWETLAREYGQKMYLWDDFGNEAAKDGYDSLMSPREFVDSLAERYDLDSYANLHWGNNPPGFERAKYEKEP